MKLSEIEVGKEYAVGSKSYPQRARVIEKGRLGKRVYSGGRWDFGGHETTVTGAKVVYIDYQGKESKPVVEVPQRLVSTWAEHEKKSQIGIDRLQEQKDLLEKVRLKLEEIGIPGWVDFKKMHYSPFDNVGIKINMNFEQAKRLIGE